MKFSKVHTIFFIAGVLSGLSLMCTQYIRQEQEIYIFPSTSEHCAEIGRLCERFNIVYKNIDQIDPLDSHLHLIVGSIGLEDIKLPENYIIFQTLDLIKYPMTSTYAQQLQKAVAVWDPSNDNIARYPHSIKNYFYLPENYEFADPVILSCFLPTTALKKYKDLLIDSNTNNTDISSHLPTMFCYGILQKPGLILECGVRGGESTKVFSKIVELCNSNLIGIDILPSAKNSYLDMERSTFLCMDDRNFNESCLETTNGQNTIDIVFIDTSHLFEHTLREIEIFIKFLPHNGIFMFHDSNVTPLNNSTYIRLNGTRDSAPGNPRGVAQAIKKFFSIDFDENKYINKKFMKDNTEYQMIHYPFCNGLTVIRMLGDRKI